jgi:arylsulfatase A-like enzyme
VKGGPSGAEPWQLFDLAEDPHEQENLVDDPDHEAVARELHGHLREHLAASTDTYRLAPAFGHDGVGIVEEA